MDLSLVKKESEEKESVQLYIYKSTAEDLRTISEKEGVKFQNLIRHLFNKFIEDYKAPKTGV